MNRRTVRLIVRPRVNMRVPKLTLLQSRNWRWSTGKTFALGRRLLTPRWEDLNAGKIHYRNGLLGGE